MVSSTAQPAGASSSSLGHPAIHQAARMHQLPNDPRRSSGVALSMSPAAQAPAQHHSPHQQQAQTSGPSVVSRYVLPTYSRQASSADMTTSSMSQLNTSSNPAVHPLNASLPDILHSHMVPQIPRLRPNQRRQGVGEQRTHRERHRSESDNARHRQTHHAGSRGDNARRRTQSTSSSRRDESFCKEPCVKCVITVTSFRWVLVSLSILGVGCVVSGIVLAALHAVGSSFLFLAVMFIGLGILLVIVVCVGWKCTPRGHEPLHALFHLGQFGSGGTRERHRRRRHRHRDGNWFGGVMYPEFQYRRPPPSYAASMQDYHNQSLQELSSTGPPNPNDPSHDRHGHGSLPGSPPPSYHSRTSTMHSGMNLTGGQDSTGNSLPNSRPPTYRSRAPSRRPSLPRHEGTGTESTDDLPPMGGGGNHHGEGAGEEFSQVQMIIGGENVVRESSSDRDNVVTPSALAVAITISSSTPSSASAHQTELQQQSETDSDSLRVHQGAWITQSANSGGADADTNNQNDQHGETAPDTTDMADGTGGVHQSVPPAPQSASATTSSFTHTSLPNAQAHFEYDVQQLEQALRPLEAMYERDGIDNPGANISSDSSHYDTHL